MRWANCDANCIRMGLAPSYERVFTTCEMLVTSTFWANQLLISWCSKVPSLLPLWDFVAITVYIVQCMVQWLVVNLSFLIWNNLLATKMSLTKNVCPLIPMIFAYVLCAICECWRVWERGERIVNDGWKAWLRGRVEDNNLTVLHRRSLFF